MKRTNIKGSITVEAIVMLGLIATLTPILYKHVAERRQDIDNINEANTLLLLKNSAAEYIEANKDALTVGTIVLEPVDIGVDISGYQIGIRKDSDGTINAMIASAAGGNDLRAGKIATLLGLSAGIYSAQNTAKAWGINGVWAEDIANYGFTSLPTGIPVITTAYNKEDASGLNEEQLKEFIENTAFDKLSANKLCLSGECITTWEDITLDPLEVISACNNEQEAFCIKGREREFNQNCQQIGDAYQKKGLNAPNQIYNLTISPSATSTKKSFCWFKGQYGFSSEEILSSDCSAGTPACQTGYANNVNRNCQDIANTFTVSEITPPNTGRYYLTSSLDGTGVLRSCYFLNKTGWLGSGVIAECNNATNGTCASGYSNSLNRTCQNIYDANQKDDVAFAEGYYTLTASNSDFLTNQYCLCEGSSCYSAAQIIDGCNAAKDINNLFCRIGYDKDFNRTCAKIIGYYPQRSGEVNFLTSTSEVTETCCAANDELKKGIASIHTAITTQAIGTGSNKTPTFKEFSNLCAGNYKIILKGEAGYAIWGETYYCPVPGYTNDCSGAGGILTVFSKRFSKGTNLIFKSISGYYWNFWEGTEIFAASGAGVGMWENGVIKLVAGGGGIAASGGGGYTGGYGIQNDYNRYDGYSHDGSKGASQAFCSASPCSGSAWGGRSAYYATRWVLGFGGTAYCASTYTCLHMPGGNGRVQGTSGYSAADYGNSAEGVAEITFLE